MTMKSNKMLVSVVVLVFVNFVAGQVIVPDSCPTVTVKENFEAAKYLGKWYEAEKYHAAFETGAVCVYADYSLNSDGTIKVTNSAYNSTAHERSSVTGSAKFAGSPSEAKLLVTFPSVGRTASYWVLDTDYENYAVVWSCTNLDTRSLRFAWILTRAQNPAGTILDSAYAVLDKNGISKSELTKTTQTGCN